MSYALPKDLAAQFWTSLKTVYNYLSKHGDKIRTRKENGKTIVNIEDFKNAFYKTSKAVQNLQNDVKEVSNNRGFELWKEEFSKLQNKYNHLLETSETLKKRSDGLENQLSKYGIMLADTKKERAVLFDKYEQLNQQYNQKVEQFSLDKIKMSKHYYTLLGISLILALIIIRLLSPTRLTYFN